MDADERDYEYIELGDGDFLPGGVLMFGSVAVPEKEAIDEFVVRHGCRPSIVYKGKGGRLAYFMPIHPKESEVNVNQDGETGNGR